jgi:hypothetical protein
VASGLLSCPFFGSGFKSLVPNTHPIWIQHLQTIYFFGLWLNLCGLCNFGFCFLESRVDYVIYVSAFWSLRVLTCCENACVFKETINLGRPNYKPEGHPKPVLWFGSEFSLVGEGASLISHPNQFCGGSGFCSTQLESDPLPSLSASRSLSLLCHPRHVVPPSPAIHNPGPKHTAASSPALEHTAASTLALERAAAVRFLKP